MKKKLVMITVATVLITTPPIALSGGLLGDVSRWVGDRTGVKPLKKLGDELDNGSRDIKKEVPILNDVEEAVARPIRETAKYADNNKETVAAVAVVAAVGWAACADGCTLVGNLLIGGAAIPLASTDINSDKDKPQPPSRLSLQKSEPKNNTNPTDDGGSEDSDIGNPPSHSKKEYPEGFSKVEYPDGVPPKLVYRSIRDDLESVFNEFAFPTTNAVIRYSSNADPAGGTMESPRNGVSEKIESRYAPEARRVHAGIDFLTFPGQEIYAPMSGKVETIKEMTNKNGLQMITIRAQDGTLARVLYTQPVAGLKAGDSVLAGQTNIGNAQSIGAAYNLDTTPNHVHVDYTDHLNRRFDPWTNQVVDKRGP